MFPYNRATNRGLRQSRRKTKMEEQNLVKPEIENTVEEDEDITWDYTEYKLTYVLDNFKLPQIVRVVEGFMFTEDDSLASGTVLTIHGQQKVEQICAVDRNGQGAEIYIPLSCPYKVRVAVPDRANIYKSVKDLCNATPLPKCVIVNEKISVAGVKIPSGRMLIIKSISKNRNDQAEGISVELLDNTTKNLVLPLKIVGNFAPCPLPADQNRTYFVRELSQRPFPLWVNFLSSFEKSPPYGPHMGVVKFVKLQTTEVVFSTSTIDGEKFAISFSRDLPVTVEMARDALLVTSPYSNKCRIAGEQVDIDVLSHLTDANPYSDKYQSAIYADIFALRKAFVQKKVNEDSIDSFESLQSDTSYSEDRSSTRDAPRYVMDKSFHANGSIGSSFGADSHSVGSQSNQSIGSSSDLRHQVEEYASPQYVYLLSEANKIKSDDEDLLEDDEGYTIIAERMDSPSAPIKQSRTRDSVQVRPYLEVDIIKPSPTQVLSDTLERIKPPPVHPQSRPPASPANKVRLSKSTSSAQEAEPYSSKRSLDRTYSDGLASNMPDQETWYYMPRRHHPETLSVRSHDSEKSDCESIASEYLSVMSLPGLTTKAKEDLDPVHSQRKRCPPKKPERPKGPPRPIPRTTSKKIHNQENFSQSKDQKEEGEMSVPSLATLSSGKDITTEKDAGIDDRAPLPIKTTLGSSEAAVSLETQKREEDTSSDLVKSKIVSREKQRACSGEDQLTKNDIVEIQEIKTEIEVDPDRHEADQNVVNCDDALTKQESKEKISRKFSVVEACEDDVGNMLDEIQLSDFKEIFKDEQINGALLEGLDIETLNDLGLNQFQAVKLLDYVKGWRPNEDCGGDSNDPDSWTTEDVFKRLDEINLKLMAVFCAQNQVDGKLLQSLIDSQSLECLTQIYSVGLNKFNTNKLIRYVKQGWRPDTSK